MAHDLTENKKLTEALALAQTEATAATLIEGMARDFDQILTNVFGNLTIAKNLNGPHNAIAVRLNEMERALQRARDLIEQMFTITPEQGEPKVRVGAGTRGAGGRRHGAARNHGPRGISFPAQPARGGHRPGSVLPRDSQHRHQFRRGDGQGRRAFLRGKHPPHPIFLPPGSSPEGGRLHLPPHPGPGPRHLGKSDAPRLRALLHHAQRLAGARAHHRALFHSTHGRNDPGRFHSRRGHHGFPLPAGGDRHRARRKPATQALPSAATVPRIARYGRHTQPGTQPCPAPGHAPAPCPCPDTSGAFC